MDNLKDKCGFGIQDDYDYWAKNNRSSSYGKLHFIDPTDYNTQHIFFDDNITGGPNDDIVDVRHLITNEKISHKKAYNKHVVKVDTDRAIVEQDYFLKIIETCELRRTEEIKRIEGGMPSDEETTMLKEPIQDDWGKILSNEDYLKLTVLPLLFQVYIYIYILGIKTN